MTDAEEIRNLVADYCLALDYDDVERWVALFTPDAGYEVYGKTFQGHEGLRDMMRHAPGGLHLGGTPLVSVDGDRAAAEHNLLFIERESGSLRQAVYREDLVKTDGGWRIAHIRCRFLTAGGLSDRPDR